MSTSSDSDAACCGYRSTVQALSWQFGCLLSVMHLAPIGTIVVFFLLGWLGEDVHCKEQVSETRVAVQHCFQIATNHTKNPNPAQQAKAFTRCLDNVHGFPNCSGRAWARSTASTSGISYLFFTVHCLQLFCLNNSIPLIGFAVVMMCASATFAGLVPINQLFFDLAVNLGAGSLAMSGSAIVTWQLKHLRNKRKQLKQVAPQFLAQVRHDEEMGCKPSHNDWEGVVTQEVVSHEPVVGVPSPAQSSASSTTPISQLVAEFGPNATKGQTNLLMTHMLQAEYKPIVEMLVGLNMDNVDKATKDEVVRLAVRAQGELESRVQRLQLVVSHREQHPMPQRPQPHGASTAPPT
eukprot:TRINITY_DN32800_c0_g1_i1.p1 TRINITY_DN32800_c0_g1~~TRINITY_DN32800_c0_g1_i1.p1  ORF type:complete len:350 (+),score=21.16 TRINITY_DN32800_c0_g1_i1:30-1079(+)